MSGFKGAYRALGYTEVENLLLMPNQYSGVVKGTWAVATGSFLNSHLIYNTTGNVIGGVNDELYFNQSLSGGIYNIIISAYRTTNGGTYQMLIDGIPYGDVIDTYNATGNMLFTNTIRNIHIEQGFHTISFRVAGKNASSTAYYFYFQQLIIQKQ